VSGRQGSVCRALGVSYGVSGRKPTPARETPRRAPPRTKADKHTPHYQPPSDDGTPNILLRQKGAEMWLELEGEGDPLLKGVIVRPYLREDAAPPEDTESGAAE
jgi:hypothetical protein